MADLWEINLASRQELASKLSKHDEQELYHRRQRQLRKTWIRMHIYRGYGSYQPDKFADDPEGEVTIAAQ